MGHPKITVFMAAYNQADFIQQSINSVLTQSFSDFELIIVNDGSIDNTTTIVESFNDNRIRLVHNDGNKGLIYTRNRLLTLAQGEYIAILDGDDIAYQDRLKLQYNFLLANPEVVLCGGHAAIINEHGNKTGDKLRVPVNNTVDLFMLFGNPFVNSTTMFKTSVFTELNGYQNYTISEDFDLFIRMAEKYKVANLDETLVDYRVHSNNTSTLNTNTRLANERKIISHMQKRIGLPYDERRLNLHVELFNWTPVKEHLNDYSFLFNEFKLANNISKRYDPKIFNQFLFNKWMDILKFDQINSLSLKWYFKNEIFESDYFSFKKFRRAFKNSIKQLLN
ncbi:glycosyltransferase family 2 protein [Pedobacter sp. KBS0701]|uniref:glycosyltransferase family 2 protein n=1 Tax=unclassified Pedobacter TaxID=2628915 RepID=UPI00110E140C|nr:glycosyltransferase [Pedobacter sp. KBS0701]QDW27626.1 glycosyltransferase [Pedobacter sp. KBS0701]